eukprot:159992-Amphidinium_carterae.1
MAYSQLEMVVGLTMSFTMNNVRILPVKSSLIFATRGFIHILRVGIGTSHYIPCASYCLAPAHHKLQPHWGAMLRPRCR